MTGMPLFQKELQGDVRQLLNDVLLHAQDVAKLDDVDLESVADAKL